MSTILKGTIEEKVFRIEAPMCAVVNPRFMSSMYYRYYYIMFVKCNYEGLSFRRSFCRPVDDNLDDLMSENLNKKPNLKCIDEYWVKKAVKKANLQKDGFTLNQNSDICLSLNMNLYSRRHLQKCNNSLPWQLQS